MQRWWLVVSVLLVLSGCAGMRESKPSADAAAVSVTSEQTAAAPAVPADDRLPWEIDEAEAEDTDPYESFNRKVYKFNTAIDRAILKPLAKGYDRLLPDTVQRSIGNFFRNLAEPTVIVNSLLQGKFEQSFAVTARFLANSTLGIGGLFDVATKAGVPPQQEDFGQTLAVWGAEQGPYIVLPLLGPRTVRDSFGLVADWYTDPVTYIDNEPVRYGLRGLNLVDTRWQLMDASRVLEQATDDEYLFVREAYLQRRKSLIRDGKSE